MDGYPLVSGCRSLGRNCLSVDSGQESLQCVKNPIPERASAPCSSDAAWGYANRGLTPPARQLEPCGEPSPQVFHDRGFKGWLGTPTCFILSRPDGTRLRDDRGWPALQTVRWYRPDG